FRLCILAAAILGRVRHGRAHGVLEEAARREALGAGLACGSSSSLGPKPPWSDKIILIVSGIVSAIESLEPAGRCDALYGSAGGIQDAALQVHWTKGHHCWDLS